MTLLNRSYIIVIATVILGIGYLRYSATPPGQKRLVNNFRLYKPIFANLKEMMHSDVKVQVVAPWDVEFSDSAEIAELPKHSFSKEHFQECLTLLNAVSGKMESRMNGDNPGICVQVWRWGFVDTARHVAICALEKIPSNTNPR